MKPYFQVFDKTEAAGEYANHGRVPDRDAWLVATCLDADMPVLP